MAEIKKGYLALSQKFVLEEHKTQNFSDTHSSYISSTKNLLDIAESHQHQIADQIEENE